MVPEKIKKNISLQLFFSSIIPVILANTIVSMIISLPLLHYGSQDSNSSELIIDLIPFVSHYFMLNFAMGIIVFLLFIILPRKIIFFLNIILFFLLQAILLIDTKIYSIFHYHINSLVLNVITTEGISDSVILGKGTIYTFIFWLIMILISEVIINLYPANLQKAITEKRLHLITKTSRILFIICLCLILLDKGIYAYGDLFNKTIITKNAKLYPLYQPLTIKRFASDVLHINVNRELNLKFPTENSMLNYPKQQLKFNPSSNKNYNIIIIIADGLRFDMLNKEIMPSLWDFSRNNIIYANHYSGGNGSRFGIFSLLYGIQGTYWHNFLAQRRSPVLIDTFIDRQYDFKILSSTRLTFPEFRKTAFVKIPEYIEDNFSKADAPTRDRIITEKLINYISSRKKQKPFFAFLFYNSPHQPFLYPEDFQKFKPVSDKEINYFKDIGRDKIHKLRNRYKNAVYYNDYLIGKVINSLKENQLLKDTIVIITGDHGEEFYENGYFGHTSSFNDYQLKTVFVMHFPKIKPGIVKKLTSHLDLVPTLMESLGCTLPAEYYSQGISLLSDKEHTYITAAKWDKAAVIDNDYMIVFSTELYNLGAFEVRRKDNYTLIENSRMVIKQKKTLLFNAALRMSEFYR